MEPEQAALDPAVLGRILLLQTGVQAAPNDQCLAETIIAGLADIPGVAGRLVYLRGHVMAATDGLSLPADCQASLEAGRPPIEHGPDCPTRPDENGWFHIIQTTQGVHGILRLELSEPAAFVPYAPFVANATNLVALSLENTRITARLRDAAHELEQQVAERTASLQQSESRLRLALESANAGVWEWDLRTNENVWSDELWKVYGLEPRSNVPSHAAWRQIIHPDDRERTEQVVQAAARDGSELNVEWRVCDGDGTIRWLMSRGRPLRDETGAACRFVGIVVDITTRKQAEEALRDSEARYRRLLKLAPLPLGFVNMEGALFSFNDRFHEVFGYAHAEIPTIREWWDLAYPDPEYRRWVISTWEAAVQRATEGHTDIEPIEYRVTCKDGTVKVMEISGIPVDDNLIATFIDVTGRRRAEAEVRRLNVELENRVVERTAELEAAYQELESFSYSVSHDLRAPLRAVDGFSQILLEDFSPQLPDEARRLLQTIRTSAQHMGTLIDDLLRFSRLGRQSLTTETVNTDQLVHAVVEDLRPREPGRHVEMRVAPLCSCRGDAAMVKQVWINLLDNAMKYTRRREQAIIEVGCRRAGEECICFVRDNGTGFDMQYADKLFGVFQRLHHADEFEGTGVGLAIVQRIVQRHGGRVWAEAEPDRGATFFFTLHTDEAQEHVVRLLRC